MQNLPYGLSVQVHPERSTGALEHFSINTNLPRNAIFVKYYFLKNQIFFVEVESLSETTDQNTR